MSQLLINDLYSAINTHFYCYATLIEWFSLLNELFQFVIIQVSFAIRATGDSPACRIP